MKEMDFKNEELRKELLEQFTDAVDEENWLKVMKIYEQLEQIIEPGDIVMQIINMDMKSIPIEVKEKETNDGTITGNKGR